MNTSDSRRRFLAALPGLLTLGLAACSREPASGPVAIDWGNDADARCHMKIRDKGFAAEIRDPAGKVWKFDDIGCAVFWLSQQSYDERTPGIEFWVADFGSGQWLDARRASYLEGKRSPMRYQFAALGEAEPGTVGYGDMKQKVLARGH